LGERKVRLVGGGVLHGDSLDSLPNLQVQTTFLCLCKCYNLQLTHITPNVERTQASRRDEAAKVRRCGNTISQISRLGVT